MCRLDICDKNETHGSFILDGTKLFVYIRDLNCKFPFQMVLRVSNDNQRDGIQLLQQIVDHTIESINKLHIHNIETFDYNLHFDNLITKYREIPIYPSSFIVQ